MSEGTCKDCRWWVAARRGPGIVKIGDPRPGECRRFPVQLIVINGGVGGGFAPCDDTFWCGEFKTKPDKGFDPIAEGMKTETQEKPDADV